MKKNNKGFVVSAVLYPLLVLFLALIMGLLSMSDTRKRILDKMKLEISDSIFDEATCSCDTILNKLNYLIKNGVSGGGGGGSYTQNVLGLNVNLYEDPSMLPNIGNGIGDIAVITDVEISSYYVSSLAPSEPKHGMVWIVQDKTSKYFITSDYSRIGVSYAMQYICNEEQTECEWQAKKAYVYDNAKWILLYYVPVKDGIVDLTSSDINAEIVHTYEYTGEYQEFVARFSGYYQIELWGAQGGTNNSSYPGGLGSYTKGDIYLDAGESLYVYVGGTTTSTSGGWNGGGDGVSIAAGSAGGGGGATDIRLLSTTEKNIWNEFESLKSRIMVAAGGGGGSYYAADYYGKGGAAGGLNGYAGSNNANSNSPGTGASTTFGGSSFYNTSAYEITTGSFGVGGRYYGSWSEGGGGGGYYGGGGGGFAGAGGGGGSSYISGHEGNNSLIEESLPDNLIYSGKSTHYSEYYFSNTTMIDGNGYNWTTIKEELIKMPTYAGDSTMNGNSGNGYAKITLKTIEVKEKEKLDESVWNFTYTNGYQILDVEKSGVYQIELWGAEGNTNNSSYLGGKGSYTLGKIFLSKGKKLYIYVGGKSVFLSGGWNGGGAGVSLSSGSAGGGGGASDVRLINTSSGTSWNEFDSLKSRIMVAAGGGGGSYYTSSYYGKGGAGGGLNAYAGSNNSNANSPGSGATTNGFGLSHYEAAALSITSGGFGYGGRYNRTWSSGGGGGGYYGGGGGGYAGAGGGGGSSYISGHNGCNSIEESSTADNIIHNGSAYHYSNYYFYDTQMIDGNGYNWSTYKQTAGSMPVANSSSTQTGQSGNGYAKVILLEETETNPKEKDEIYWGYESNSKWQKFLASKTGTYKVELWGAQGGTNNSSYPGGAGGYTSGEIYLTSGTTLYVYVGNMKISPSNLEGGWNGGGAGVSLSSGSAGGGGGATDIRVTQTSSINVWNEAESLKSRIMVAAGGGGGSYYASSYYGKGGAAGGLTAYIGSNNQSSVSPGTGGTQIAGGNSSYQNAAISITQAGFGYGGRYYGTWSEGGGGSGWYGGGGGSFAGAGGGGGSSYISGHAGCIAVTSAALPKVETYTTLADSISYTGYKFINTQMIDGQGYPWTTEKTGSSSGMPTYDGTSTMTGNSGNGYAKITYLGA